MSRRAAFLLLAFAALAAPAAGRAETLEPPPEATAGADYEAERSDTLGRDLVEVGFAAAGSAGGTARRTRSLRFSADSIGGSFREGQGDPLTGGSVEGRTRGGVFGVGRLAPRWGRGLVFGTAPEPWSSTASDRGAGAAFRGRSGEGVWLRGGGGLRFEALGGRFDRRGLGAVVLRSRDVGLGLVGDGRGSVQASLALERGRTGAEWALDRRGGWRAETAHERRHAGWTSSLRVRGGHARFRSLAEPRRSGPAQALALGVSRRARAAPGPEAPGSGSMRIAPGSIRGLVSVWRFRAGVAGARAALEAEVPLGAGALAAGIEEQHGSRREPTSASGYTAGGFRQGWWTEWRGGTPALGLALRHESWGARSLARDPVRTVTTVRVQCLSWGGARLRVDHSCFVTRRGESVYLPEAESDRLVLRALSGAGTRTRVELRLPFAGGTASGGLSLSPTWSGRARAPRWTLDWTRRTRLGRKG